MMWQKKNLGEERNSGKSCRQALSDRAARKKSTLRGKPLSIEIGEKRKNSGGGGGGVNIQKTGGG